MKYESDQETRYRHLVSKNSQHPWAIGWTKNTCALRSTTASRALAHVRWEIRGSEKCHLAPTVARGETKTIARGQWNSILERRHHDTRCANRWNHWNLWQVSNSYACRQTMLPSGLIILPSDWFSSSCCLSKWTLSLATSCGPGTKRERCTCSHLEWYGLYNF